MAVQAPHSCRERRRQSDHGQVVRSRRGRKNPLYYEAFEICEYGAQPDDARIRELFPMLPRKS